ncbi:PDZ domain-containing RING finger protein 4-like [Struthio camelus]|uniref:PDZ domain-containing RING finger protein 4-like n=1 Tax=Struthio camelus TaxID=8801 RepID=UPI003603C9AF
MIFLLSFWDQIKVNGKDISCASLQEVLEVLQSTGEQIMLEVHGQKSAHKPPQTSDAATQTDSRGEDEQRYKEENCTLSDFNLCLDGSVSDYLLPQDCNSENESNYLLPALCTTVKDKKLNYKALALIHQDEPSSSSCCRIPEALSSVSVSLAESESAKGKEEKQAFLLHPEWDSRLGFTDISTQPDENSGPDVEEEQANCQNGPSIDLWAGITSARGGLPTDDFFTYDELSDSSSCGISAEKHRRFQDLVEGRCNQYRYINRAQQMPPRSGGQEGCKQCKQKDQWLPKCLPVGENSTAEEKGPQHRSELSLEGAASRDRSKANENNKSIKQGSESEPASCSPTHITADPEQVTLPYHARHYRSYMSLLQERAAVECQSNQARVSAKPKQWNKSPEGKAGDNGSRWRLPYGRSKQSLKKQHKNWLLKDRALQITEERNGTTTDEDALSELKIGKYWNKAQRKQHMLLAKEHKQRKEFKMQSQREQLSKEKASNECRRNFNIVELSQKKLIKNRSKKILDNWITIQELLTHGTRSADGTTYSPLLSVTTV